MKKTDISIIVPIYNAEKYLKKCIDSLVNQTKKEIEIILINDGSTDSSERIIKEYKDERIKYFKNKNQGIGKTRNFGIEKATGKYLLFVDSDDYLDKNACEKLYNKIENDSLDLLVYDFYREFDNGKKEEEKLQKFDISNLKENPKLLLNINLSPWNKLYKTEVIKGNNTKFVENLKYEDAPFVVEAIINSKRIGKLDESLYYYMIHSNSETTIRDKRIFDILEIVDIIRKKVKKLKSDSINEVLDTLTISILMNYNIQQRMQKNKKVGMEFIDKSFEYLQRNIPSYKNNVYFKDRNMLKSIIEKNKQISKLYCRMYRVKK
ncbi:MAG: glycosyltransferase [Bacilli bacterium]|nr:glycosyltransferase [Bacilli bacterium]